MIDKQYTAAEVREAFVVGARWEMGNSPGPGHENAGVEALRRYPDKEDKRV
jgi:hypothetical protein